MNNLDTNSKMVIQDNTFDRNEDRSKSNEYTDLKINQANQQATPGNKPVNTVRIGARKTNGRQLTLTDVQ